MTTPLKSFVELEKENQRLRTRVEELAKLLEANSRVCTSNGWYTTLPTNAPQAPTALDYGTSGDSGGVVFNGTSNIQSAFGFTQKEKLMLDVNTDLKKTADELDAFRVHRDTVLRTCQRLQDEAFQLRAIADLKIKLASRIAQVQEEVAFDENDDTE